MKFSKRKKIILLTISLLLVSGGIVFYYIFDPYHWFLENHYSKLYDSNNPQKIVTTYKEIDEVLKNFKAVSYSQLDKGYIDYSKSEEAKFKKILSEKIYYEVKGEDIFKFLVGNFRIKDFLAKDQYYNENLKNLSEDRKQYLLIDKKLLYALLALQDELEKAGYNRNGFIINYAHRHPLLNKEVGGASVSYHIQGKAIDLVILDINKDGIPTMEDKNIVMKILNDTIIKDKGGIGCYPWSMVVHFDVRGYKARWDKQ